MFYEYALEPAALSSWDRARFFLDSFGPWRGRFLAEYPRQWKRMAYEGLACPDIEKKRIVERLRQLDKRVFSPRPGAPYDRLRSWIDNALTEHQRLPFNAIIAAEFSAHPHVLDSADVDDRDELWRVETGRFVRREPRAFVQALEMLLIQSKRLVFIDPHFRADQDDKTQPLVAFCELVAGKCSVEMHCSDHAHSHDQSMRVAARALPTILPAGVEVTLHCWRERSGGKRLHNRYVITEVGGVKLGDGIENGGTGDDDHLSILDETSRQALWDQYVGISLAFDPAGPPGKFVGTRANRR